MREPENQEMIGLAVSLPTLNSPGDDVESHRVVQTIYVEQDNEQNNTAKYVLSLLTFVIGAQHLRQFKKKRRSCRNSAGEPQSPSFQKRSRSIYQNNVIADIWDLIVRGE
jgi:hypothetical protein